VVRQRCQDRVHNGGRLTLLDQSADQTAFGDPTGCESFVGCLEAAFGQVVVNVVGDEQRDQDVGVEQPGQDGSSSSARTSSVVVTVPSRTTGRPVRSLRETVATGPVSPWPRRIKSTMVALNVRDVSRAIETARRCKSSGRSIVVLTGSA
jgi:hypothetical protein